MSETRLQTFPAYYFEKQAQFLECLYNYVFISKAGLRIARDSARKSWKDEQDWMQTKNGFNNT